MDFDYKGLLAKVAPMIGGAIGGGPFGAMAATAALEVLGLAPEKGKEEDQFKEALKTLTPDQAVKMKDAELKWKATMKELGIKEKDLHARDRASARDMAAKTSILPQAVLSGLYTIGYFMVLYMFLTGEVQIADSIKAEFGIVLGVLTAGQVQIMNFWFGSSSGSKDKNTKGVA